MRAQLSRTVHALRVGVTAAEDEWFLWHGRADCRFRRAFAKAREVPGWYPEPVAAAAFAVLADLRPTCVVEIGSYMGRSTTFLATAMEELGAPGRVVAIDPHTGDRQQLERLGVSELPSLEMFRLHVAASGLSHRVHPMVQTAHEAADGWTEAIDFLFVDGWHSYASVMEDGHDWLPHLSKDGVAIFDDVGNYPEVRKAVQDLAAEGLIHLYGEAFLQAFGGCQRAVPEPVQHVLRAYRPLSGRLKRIAGTVASRTAPC